MKKTDDSRCACQICGNDRRPDLRRAILAGPAVAELIQGATGRFSDDGACHDRVARQAIPDVVGLPA